MRIANGSSNAEIGESILVFLGSELEAIMAMSSGQKHKFAAAGRLHWQQPRISLSKLGQNIENNRAVTPSLWLMNQGFKV